jgi:hypothetical protein
MKPKTNKLRYKDRTLRSRWFAWLRGRDQYNNFRLERLVMRAHGSHRSRKVFRRIDSISIDS